MLGRQQVRLRCNLGISGGWWYATLLLALLVSVIRSQADAREGLDLEPCTGDILQAKQVRPRFVAQHMQTMCLVCSRT